MENAKQAEKIAQALQEAHDASATAIVHLARERDRMASMGLATDRVEGLLARATALMQSFVERGGDENFPAYEEAGQCALEGLDLARERTRKFIDASKAITEAERSLREFRDTNANLSPESYDTTLGPATAALRDARDAVAAGEYDRARERALQGAATVDDVRKEHAHAIDALHRADAAVRQLRAEGAPTEDLDIGLEHARTSLAAGNPSEALRLVSDVTRQFEQVQAVHRSLLLHLRAVQAAVAEAEQWGFNVRTARETLRDAGVLLRGGRYDDARDRLDRALAIAEGVRERHRTVAERIADLRGPVSTLTKKGGPVATDAVALLARAEGLFDEGAYDDCAGTLDALDGLLERAGVPSHGPLDPRTPTDRSTDAR